MTKTNDVRKLEHDESKTSEKEIASYDESFDVFNEQNDDGFYNSDKVKVEVCSYDFK